MKIGVLGSGTMGISIGHFTTIKDHQTIIYDSSKNALKSGEKKLSDLLKKLKNKGKYSKEDIKRITSNLTFTDDIKKLKDSELIIEAIIEDINIKKEIFSKIEKLVDNKCIITSNTSSLSIASLASSLKENKRFIGMHFFNPANLMPLVEIIPAIQTSQETLDRSKNILVEMGKVVVIAKDTPGFIVNRVARPFYGEAIRIYEEGIANVETIDWATKEIGGFRMGPFELMDFIGNDINYMVTETVFKEFYFDSRYKPSFTQKRLMEAGYLGKKSGKGFYDYNTEEIKNINKNRELGKKIVFRILSMLINEASDALFLKIASKEDIDLAMTKGVNYPKGLLAWADEIGIDNVLETLENLYNTYKEDRYRPSPILRKMCSENSNFY
ncbi:MAG: 3-hydroxyacyl-CoA dehydrogenase NAD-binding domain-containing protein [Flavobacteriales bacterium]|jgi:3-hydroxybutyryl-CoA dehydrogenase|nr:3-hydroxyacyl-CoA dehydrogenase NAD-binding domain-containing protein [Flavobacteriales bacterium]